ncbi:MAG TPA: hypothetical protein IGR64_18005 [Leptolyngbyaceae cyanobacterium M65_K2018_010]|nr:hypothetical protein [Leptolyngbyaceae cyanobacterium M65_K2018_010]
MKIERPNARPLSHADLDQLDTLRAVCEKAIADGVLTQAESSHIQSVLWADGQAIPQELNVIQALIWNKLQSGELMMEWR